MWISAPETTPQAIILSAEGCGGSTLPKRQKTGGYANAEGVVSDGDA